jgi:hypothetical protein
LSTGAPLKAHTRESKMLENTLQSNSQLEVLSGQEIDEVSGGFLPLLLGAFDLAIIAYDAYKLKQIVNNK